MSHYKDQILACDFFTIETLFLKTFYVLFFIELGSRRVHFAGCTRHPNATWVTQQARQVIWELQEREPIIRFLIRDNDQKFTQSSDSVFQSEGIRVITTPFQAPNANAHAERWVRSVREECLDKILIINQPHLHRTMREYIQYYNHKRLHSAIFYVTPFDKMTGRDVEILKTREEKLAKARELRVKYNTKSTLTQHTVLSDSR